MEQDLAATASVGGFADSRFAQLEQLFRQRIADGTEIGASVAVTLDGKLVVDLYGGHADEARSRPWNHETIVNVNSVTKTMAAVTLLLLADRDALDLDASVAVYWPEFAAGGKGEIKVRHILSHSAGLSGWQDPMTPADLYDWEKATTLLARQTPYWEPGTAVGYHGLTQGYLLGEVVRRATGERLADIFRREIGEPLGADFHLGLDSRHDYRVADLTEAPPLRTPPRAEPTPLMLNAMANPPLFPFPAFTATRDWRAAEIYAANGHGNGRSISKVHALLANGGEIGGKRLMSEAGCRRALEFQIAGQDLVLSMPTRFGMGFGLPGELLRTPHPDICFWPGAGNALAVIDMKSRMSFGYAANRTGGSGSLVDPRAADLLNAAWEVLDR